MVTNRLNLHGRPATRLAVQMMLLLMSSHEMLAQNLIGETYLPGDPQVWSFIKYSGMTPDLYTGTVRADIPIYTYKDLDFEIPVSLSYASNGYMPNIQANIVGLGWTLNAGGVIDRRVQGFKDEIIESQEGGYYEYVRTNQITNIWNRIPPENSILRHDRYYRNQKSYDTESDIYTFSVPGHQGRFLIDEYGEAKFFDTNHPNGEYKATLDSICQSFFQSQIAIQDGNGYVYEFGGLSPGVNYYISTSELDTPNSSIDLYSDSWPLTRIIAPNGRYVEFQYSLDADNIKTGNCQPMMHKKIVGTYIEDYGSDIFFIDLGSSSYYNVDDYRAYKSLTERPVARLSAIKVMDKDGTTIECKISFTYGSRSPESYNVDGVNLNQLPNPGKLTGITVKNVNDDTLVNCSLTYTTTGSSSNPGNPVLLLKRVHIDGLGNYSMTYYNEAKAFPYHGTVSIDHWGFWNNETIDYDPLHLLPSIQVNTSNNTETILSNNRNPAPLVARNGMLYKLVYPTGGWTVYEYEANDYNKIIIKDGTGASQGFPALQTLSSPETAGGVRLKRKKDFSNNNTFVSTDYLYLDDNGNSSGIMYNFPRYEIVCYMRNGYPDINIEYVSQTQNNWPGYLADQAFLGYSCVKEVFADSSYRVYRFTDYSSVPDVSEYDVPSRVGDAANLYNGIIFDSPLYADHYFRTPQSLAHCRGKLLSVENYNSSQERTDKTTYSYSLTRAKSQSIRSLKLAADSIYIFRSYVGDYPIVSETYTEYNSSGNRTTSKTLSYNTLGELKTTTMVESDGGVLKEENLRLSDLASSERTTAENQMISRNILAPVIYHLVSFKPNGQTYIRLTDGTHYVYGGFYTGGHQHYVTSRIDKAVVNAGEAHTNRNNVPWKTVLTLSAVDAYGRPMEETDANGITTSYLWGYGGLYPVAEVVNCTLSQLGQIIHTSLPGTTWGWTGLDDNTATAFRSISGVSFTHWKYLPLVGPTSVRGPDKRETSYEYSPYGRLTKILLPDGNTQTEYVYSADRK